MALSPELRALDRCLAEEARRPESLTCRDCGARGPVGYHGTPSGTSCDPCWRVRQRHGWEFEARALPQLQAAQRKAG